MDKMCQTIKEELLEQMDLTRDYSDDTLEEMIWQCVNHYSKAHLLTLEERANCQRIIFNSFRKLDALEDLLSDPEITEIMINGSENIFYEKEGQLYPWEHGHLTSEKLSDLIQRMVGAANRTVNEAQPIVDTRLGDGSRVNVVMEPVSLSGPNICIRKFSQKVMTLDYLIENGSISREAAKLLALLVKAGYNIFVSGGTGTGKTTFLNALSEYIPHQERVITIEDSAELQMQTIPNLVRLETRMSNGSGAVPITIRDLIKTALRMRPDRIIVGEVRGAEALDMLQSFNTGHDGSLSTGHANSSEDMLSRLETMVLMAMDLPMEAIRRQIASGIDILVHLGRMRDKSRKVLQISEVIGVENGRIRLQTMYQFCEIEEKEDRIYGIWKRREALQNMDKIYAKGLLEEYQKLFPKEFSHSIKE